MAVCTLRLWEKLRSIILQDAAVLFLLYPARKAHPLFRLPVFCSPEFLVSLFLSPRLLLIVVSNLFFLFFTQSFVEVMRTRLEMLSGVVDTSLEASLPEIQRQFNDLNAEVKTGNETVCQKMDGLGTMMSQSMDARPTREELAVDFAQMAVRLAGGRVSAVAGGRVARNDTTTAVTRTEDSGPEWERATAHTIQIRDIDCVDDLYHEFKGLGMFEGLPIVGGLEECDRRWKTRWR